jgi:hypothetical protein
MEGPSLKAVADNLLRFEGDSVLSASGNAKIAMDDLAGQRIDRIFTIGKEGGIFAPDARFFTANLTL